MLNYRRDYVDKPVGNDPQLGRKGDYRAHGGDAVADALLAKADSSLGDKMMLSIYKVTSSDIKEMRKFMGRQF